MPLETDLKKRLSVALVLIPLTLLCLFSAPIFLRQIVVFTLTLVMVHEWSLMTKVPYSLLVSPFVATILFFMTLIGPRFFFYEHTLLHHGLAYIFVLLPFIVVYGKNYTLFTFGYFYITCAMLFLSTHMMDPQLVLWMLILIWSNDSFAYFIGKKLKGPKLWINISPNKTWSGFLGGMICGSLFSGGVADFYDIVPHPYLLSLFLSCIGHGGDLLESAVKRHYKVKDSGNLLPGHGGFLDRLDSLIAVLWGYSLYKCVTVFLDTTPFFQGYS